MAIYLFGKKATFSEVWGILAIYLRKFPCNVFWFLYGAVLLLGFCPGSVPSGRFLTLFPNSRFCVISELI